MWVTASSAAVRAGKSASGATKVSARMEEMRMDKWLWAARFFKTRALAVKACELGRWSRNGVHAKPAREVKVGNAAREE